MKFEIKDHLDEPIVSISTKFFEYSKEDREAILKLIQAWILGQYELSKITEH